MNPFANIIGNESLKGYLVRMVHNRAVANSLLFAGPDGIGKGLFATAFAKMLLCQNEASERKFDHGVHPDLRVYQPEGKIGAHSIDSMRQFSEDVYLSPYEAERKVFIIHDADRMLPSSANALLKTFEEPALWSVIILLSSNPGALLPTILSRCRTLNFHPLPENSISQLLQEKFGMDAETSRAIAILAEGSAGNACKLAAEGGDYLRKSVLTLLSKGKLPGYTQLMQAAAEISGCIEESQKKAEESFREEMKKAYPNEPTAQQQQAIDKEVDGRSAMHLVSNAKALFSMILSWYRDMHLLHANGNRSYLINRDFEDQLEQAFQRGELLPLEKVQKSIVQTMTAIERSTPLKSCLENLFLQLNLI